MTTKKVTTKGGRKGIEERARAILADTEKYDYDTRHTVHLALRRIEFHSPGGGAEKYTTAEEAHADLPQLERELREVVERAEAGEPVGYGCNDPELKKYRDAARQVLALMHCEGVPDFINDGIYKLLMMAEQAFRVKLWRNEIDDYIETGGWSIDGLARTFRSHEAETFKLEIKKTLPELIAAVLTHRDTPAEIHNALLDAMQDMSGYGAAQKTAPYLSELLRLSAESEKGCTLRLAPGSKSAKAAG